MLERVGSAPLACKAGTPNMPHRRRTPYSLTPIERGLLNQIENDAARARAGVRSGGASSGIELEGAAACFVATGVILLALRFAPGPGAPGTAWIIPGMFLFVGALGLIKGMASSSGASFPAFLQRSPLSPLFRVLWFFRPRIWMIAWAVIIAILAFTGTPHLRITYAHGGEQAAQCGYFGLNGWQERTLPVARCPVWVWLPLN